MERKYIEAVRPLGGHVLQVDFVSGSRLLLDMEPYLDKFRFRSLADPQIWNELLSMAEQEHHRKGGKQYE